MNLSGSNILILEIKPWKDKVFNSTYYGIFMISLELFLLSAMVLLTSGKLENLAAEILKSGKIISRPREFIRIAKEMRYETKLIREGTRVYKKDDEKMTITVIPRSPVSKGLYYNIIKALEKGEPNFRTRDYRNGSKKGAILK